MYKYIVVVLLGGLISSGCSSPAQTRQSVSKHKNIECEKKFTSPTGEFKVCVHQPDTMNSHGFLGIFIIRNSDEKVLYQEHGYLDKINWLSDSVVRVTLRPEVKKYTGDHVAGFDFNVRQRRKTQLKNDI